MANITHSSMRKPGSNVIPVKEEVVQQNKDFVVDDLSEFENGTLQEAVHPAEVKSVRPAMDEGKKKKIEDLLFLGRTSKVVEIAGHSFELSTLTHKEHNDLMKALAAVSTESADIWKIRIYTLSSAIRSIDDVAFEDLEVGQEFNSMFEKKLFVLDNMQLRVIEQLFAEYGILLEESERVVTGEAIKK